MEETGRSQIPRNERWWLWNDGGGNEIKYMFPTCKDNVIVKGHVWRDVQRKRGGGGERDGQRALLNAETWCIILGIRPSQGPHPSVGRLAYKCPKPNKKLVRNDSSSPSQMRPPTHKYSPYPKQKYKSKWTEQKNKKKEGIKPSYLSLPLSSAKPQHSKLYSILT